MSVLVDLIQLITKSIRDNIYKRQYVTSFHKKIVGHNKYEMMK